jgi:hypothetical protein
LKKGAYYLARIIFKQHEEKVRGLVAKHKDDERSPDVAKTVITATTTLGEEGFSAARVVFEAALKEYLAREGGNEDAALKNTAFATLVDARSAPR